ncbi:MAG: hypothetical protein ABSD29_03650 [Verrucomicrobiota bacterium]|jgi:hypothetical protein
MAHLWIQKTSESGQCWAVQPLGGSTYRFAAAEPYIRRADSPTSPIASELLVRMVHESTEHWFLVVAPESRLRVNGRKALLGSTTLRDRDEIRLGNGQRLYFTTERLPQVVAFPGAAQEIFCARCRKPIERGSLAVACPACGAWCHQTEELPCWRYPGTTQCPLCDQSTDSEIGFRWSPNGL